MRGVLRWAQHDGVEQASAGSNDEDRSRLLRNENHQRSQGMSESGERHWSTLRPWHTNAALLLMGYGLIWWTRQLVVEYDYVHHYHFGFDGVAAGSLLCYLGALLVLWLKPHNVDRYTFPVIIGVAVLCRLAVLFAEPSLSSDVYRYAWDGVVQHAHINPYRYVPGDPVLTFLREPNQDLFDNMNRRDYAHTIYPPVAQIIFYCITWINGSVTAMKAGMVLFEGLSVTALLLLLRQMGVRREWALLYCWSPLLIWEIGGSGHLDSVVIAFCTLAMLFRWRRQPVLTGLFLGAAIFTKFFPLVLFPALYTRTPEGKLDWKMPATAAAVGVVGYTMYLSVGKAVFGFFGGYVEEEGIDKGTRFFPQELAQHTPGLRRLAGWDWSVPGLGHPVVIHNVAYLVFTGLVMGSLAVWAWRRGNRSGAPADAFLMPAMLLATATMLIFSPHYPWYVAWLVPFVVLLRSPTVMTYICALFYLCTTALAVGSGPRQFQLNEILYSAVLVAFIMELVLRRYTRLLRPL